MIAFLTKQALRALIFWTIVAPTAGQVLSIQSLSLIHAVTKENFGPVVNGTIISLARVGNQITIQANVIIAPSTTSVIFDMDGKLRVHVDDSVPYTLSGDRNGIVYLASNALAQLGVHNISATPYSRSQGRGLAGKKYVVQFTTVAAVTAPVRAPIAKTPIRAPILRPTRRPTKVPIRAPIQRLTSRPTKVPIRAPIQRPTRRPTKVPIRAPIQRPTRRPTKSPVRPPNRFTLAPLHVPVPSPAPSTKLVSNKCGGAVNTGETSVAMCAKDLWNPTGNITQHCYAYGGPSDPCALHNNNDMNDGLFKNPSACTGNTFYLWDEPDTQGKNYTWAGLEWIKYASRFAIEIQTLRARGVQFTSPLLRAGGEGVIASNLNTFYAACGSVCHDPKSPAYININAINAFVGPWNAPGINGCRDAANYITNEVRSYNTNNSVGRRPWYVTNWSRLGTLDIQDQVNAMLVIKSFFVATSPIQRIYWFGATDYGGNSGNNFLTSTLVSKDGVSTTLGQIWEANCMEL